MIPCLNAEKYVEQSKLQIIALNKHKNIEEKRIIQ